MMIDFLESIDRLIVQTVNSWNTPFLDEVMWIVSGKLTWIPLYVFLLFLFVRQSGFKKGFFFIFCAIITVALTDLISVHLFKEMFQRYRPSHNLLLTQYLHYYDLGNGDLYKGGTYGFISSHASNFFAICTFAFLGLKKNFPKLAPFLWVSALLVAFSRIYLGVHYLSDVLVGGLIGILIAMVVFRYIFVIIIGKEFYTK